MKRIMLWIGIAGLMACTGEQPTAEATAKSTPQETTVEANSAEQTDTTAVDGTIEIVRNGKNGILVESRDAISLAEGINRMIETTNRAELEEEAKKTFNEEFSYSVFSKQYRNYYENC